MPETTWLDKRSLLIQLESYELVFEVNVHLLETDRLLAEQISHRFGMLETEVHELELRERAGDSVRYDCALDRANQILHGIKSLIDQMLDLDAFPYDDSLQKLA